MNIVVGAVTGVGSADTTATIDGTVTAGDNVHVRAKDDLLAVVVVGAGAGGVIGVGASISILTIGSETTATIADDATVRSGTGATEEIRVESDRDSDYVAVAFAGAAGIVSLGAQVLVVEDTTVSKAEVANGADIGRTGHLVVRAAGNRFFDANSVGVSIGGLAVGAAVSMVAVAGETTAKIGSADIGQTGLVRDVSVEADGTVTIIALTAALSAGILVGLTGALAIATANPAVTASMENANFRVGGDIGISAISDTNAVATSNGAAGGGLLALGIALSIANVSGSSFLNGPLGSATTPTNTVAKLIGNAGITVPGTLTISSESDNAAVASVVALAGGLIGIGAGFAWATTNGATTALLDVPSGVVGGAVIEADSADRAEAITVAGAGGLLAVGGGLPTARVVSNTSATIASDTVLTTLVATPLVVASGRTAPTTPGTLGQLFLLTPTPTIHVRQGGYQQPSTPVDELPDVGTALPTDPADEQLFLLRQAITTPSALAAGYYRYEETGDLWEFVTGISGYLELTQADGSNTPGLYRWTGTTLARQNIAPGFWAAQNMVQLAALPATGEALPGDPSEGMLFFLTAEDAVGLYRRTGTTWSIVGDEDTYFDITAGAAPGIYQFGATDFELQTIDSVTSLPSSPVAGDRVQLTTPASMLTWNGSAWVGAALASGNSVPALGESPFEASDKLFSLTVDDLFGRDAGLYRLSRGDVNVSANAGPVATATAVGINAGVLAVGISRAKAEVAPTVTASIGDNSTVNAKNFGLSASMAPYDVNMTTDVVNGTPTVSPFHTTARAIAIGATGGGLAGIESAITDAWVHGSITSFAGDVTLNVEGSTTITANSDSDQFANSNNAVRAGLVAAGEGKAHARSDITTTAYLADGADVTSGTFGMTAVGRTSNFALTTAGTSALVAGAAVAPGRPRRPSPPPRSGRPAAPPATRT